MVGQHWDSRGPSQSLSEFSEHPLVTRKKGVTRQVGEQLLASQGWVWGVELGAVVVGWPVCTDTLAAPWMPAPWNGEKGFRDHEFNPLPQPNILQIHAGSWIADIFKLVQNPNANESYWQPKHKTDDRESALADMEGGAHSAAPAPCPLGPSRSSCVIFIMWFVNWMHTNI